MSDDQIGHVSAYYSKIGVAAIELTATLSVGEKIKVKGATTDFEIEVTSMHIDHEAVETAATGASIGLLVPERVRRNDAVFRA